MFTRDAGRYPNSPWGEFGHSADKKKTGLYGERPQLAEADGVREEAPRVIIEQKKVGGEASQAK